MAIEVTPIPAFSDNYIWLIHDPERRLAAVVDPGEAAPVSEVLDNNGLRLVAILATHHHHDHIGGIEALRRRYAEVPVFGPAAESIPACTQALQEGDEIQVPEIGVRYRVLAVPFHTAGHIAFYGEGAVFCGDALFSAGCGRMFEGTSQQMHDSLAKLARLPDETLIYCGHEYTTNNLRFAATVEPNNTALQRHRQQVASLREADQPSLPTTMALERQINPFLRYQESTVREAANHHAGQSLTDDVAVLATLRRWKDSF